MQRILLLIAAAAICMSGCTTVRDTQAPETVDSMLKPKKFKTRITRTVQADYLLRLPQDYDAKSGRQWPLMLFLHGAGERGSNVWRVAIHGPSKYAKDHPEFPFILVSPQCPEGHRWSKDVLLPLLDEITAKYAVDTNRIYLTGLSMGGYGTWDLGLSHPEKFAAMVPICGGGQVINVLLASRQNAQALKTMGIWAFHGGKDPVVPLSESEAMVNALKKAGVPDVKFTVYPEAGHDSWTETYKNPELYDWLLQHHR